MKVTLFLMLSLLLACTHRSEQTNVQNNDELAPRWINSPLEGCDESFYFCVVGEGSSARFAETHALQALSSIFQTKVTGSLDSFKSSRSSSSFLQEVQEDVSTSLQVETNEVLESVSFQKKFRQDKIHYVWAWLDKRTMSKRLKEELNTLNEEIQVLWKEQKRLNFRPLVRAITKRQALRERLILLGESTPTSDVSLERVLSLNAQNKENVYLTLKEKAPDWLSEYVTMLLTEVKYKITPNANQVVSLHYRENSEHMKIEGFGKWSFHITLELVSGEQKRGTLKLTYTSHGRNKEDAFLKIRQDVYKDLEEKISSLNIEP